jgi:predicted NBD/HSP70 family sugar kinase/predicted transcriptional regulator
MAWEPRRDGFKLFWLTKSSQGLAVHRKLSVVRTGEEDAADVQIWNRRVLRSINERVLFDALRTAGTTSRAELARSTGLSKPTVSAALANLEAAGLVRRTGETVQGRGRGRAAVLYEPDPTAAYVVGIDIGRQWIRAAVAGLDGTPVRRADAPNEATSAAATVKAAANLARTVVDRGGVDWDRVVHTVVGGPGVVDPRTHRVRYAFNLPGWERAGLFDRMQEELGTGLDLLNDADLAALGEYAAGAGRGCRFFAYLWVGTGAGAGYVIDGKAFHGAHGAAGEIGYLPFFPLPVDGELDLPHDAIAAARAAAKSPKRGTLEDAIGGDGVVRLAQALGMRHPASAKEVFEAARGGDDVARRAVDHHAARLAHAVAALAAVLDPELVVLGGGIGRNADLLLDPIRATLKELTPLHPRVAPALLGDDAVLIGALATAAEAARKQVFDDRATVTPAAD